MPIGNGRLGAMVFGRVAQERLQLNEDTLWAGAPVHAGQSRSARGHSRSTQAPHAGRYKEATELASAKVMAKPLQQMPYGRLGDVLLDLPSAQIPTAYERTLDLETAIATTRYRTQCGHVYAEASHRARTRSSSAARGHRDEALISTWRIARRAGEVHSPNYGAPRRRSSRTSRSTGS